MFARCLCGAQNEQIDLGHRGFAIADNRSSHARVNLELLRQSVVIWSLGSKGLGDNNLACLGSAV